MSLLSKNIAFNLFGQGIVIILGFISFKYIYSGLGEDALGIIYFSLMMSALLTSALDMGLSKTTVREIAAHNIIDPDYIRKLTQTFSFIYWIVFVVVAVLFVVLLPVILDSWINLTTMNRAAAYLVLLILGPTTLLTIPKSFLSSICIGLQRMDVSNLVDISMAIIQQLGMIVLLVNNSNILGVAYWLGCTNILRVIIYLYFIIKLLSLDAILPRFSMDVITRVKRYTSKMMWISLVLVFHKQLDKVLVSKLLPIGVFGVYSFVYTSIGRTSLVTGAIAQAVFPFFSELDKQGRKKEIISRFLILQDFLVFGTAPIFAAVIFFSLPLFTFLLDKEKAMALQIPVIFLSMSFYIGAILRLARIYMFAISKPEQILRSDVLSLFIVFPSTIFLVYTMGITGAAFAWVVFYSALVILIVPKVYKNEFNLPPNLWFKSVISAVLLATMIYISAWLLATTISPGNIILLISAYMLATIVYGVISFNMTGSGFQQTLINYIPISQYLVFNCKKK